jgi:hypothetical protein
MDPIKTFFRALLFLAAVAAAVLIWAWWPAIQEAMGK